jgi:hypothetical protein
MTIREIIEANQEQGVNEQVVYTLITTPWGSSPSSVSCTVYQKNETTGTYTDVTSTTMPTGSASAQGDVITMPTLKLLTVDALYRMQVQFTCSGNVFEAYAYIRCRR